ncbi:helix-turn-helix domain-containing protein [Pseudomonas sp. MPR-LB5]|uniref:winged helix-turn-helix domain-containing protein n=1 Tax=Pseudomonas sp. MPR-LB5 TaxID=2070629 RepID=UPI000C87E0E8|nr:hypothetical protein C1Y15_02880 [Pseudomonas sp. MPR-LB5]
MDKTTHLNHIENPLTTYFFKRKNRTLTNKNQCVKISLTKTEFKILELFIIEHRRFITNQELIKHLEKDSENYKGLCMCFSRFQKKFEKYSHGEKLFRAVRNRGYYLIQNIEPLIETIENQLNL